LNTLFNNNNDDNNNKTFNRIKENIYINILKQIYIYHNRIIIYDLINRPYNKNNILVKKMYNF